MFLNLYLFFAYFLVFFFFFLVEQSFSLLLSSGVGCSLSIIMVIIQ